jgi:integrase
VRERFAARFGPGLWPARDKVKRNVVLLCDIPQGRTGRPSKSLTLAQAEALLASAENTSLHAYIVLSLLTGARTEELRALSWSYVGLDRDPPFIMVWRSVREWTPRELRHSFVSLLSDADVPIEHISRLVGHSSTTTTETIYRKQIHPVIVHGADIMDRIFPGETDHDA